jgi:membrane associated rhomboid family serine protease
VFIPLRDENSLKSIPFQYVTVSLIVLNVVIYMSEVGAVMGGLDIDALMSMGLTPNTLWGTPLSVSPNALAHDSTLLTYMFLHASPLHLVGNMLFLWVFGDNVEDAMGHLRFLFFYLACGVFAGIVQCWMMPDANTPTVGASGAVAGVIAAYLMLHPRVGVWVLALNFIPLRITAGLALGLWIGLQILMVALHVQDDTAWWAHIGGVIAGAVLVVVLRRPGVPLFDKGARLA